MNIKSNFLLDQNLEKFNKNEISLGIIYPKTNFNVSFLEESQHIGETKYVETKAGFNFNNGLVSWVLNEICFLIQLSFMT